MNKILLNTLDVIAKIYYFDSRYLAIILLSINNRTIKLYFDIVDIIKSSI